MKKFLLRIDYEIYFLLERLSGVYCMSLNNLVNYAIAKIIIDSNIEISDIEKTMLSYIFLDSSRKKSHNDKEVKCALINLKNSLMRFIVKGNSSERVFEILQNEKKRIDLCLSKQEKKELNKWKLKDIKRICDMVTEAKSRHLKDSEILAVGFDVFRKHDIRDMRTEVLKEIDNQDKKETKHMRK